MKWAVMRKPPATDRAPAISPVSRTPLLVPRFFKTASIASARGVFAGSWFVLSVPPECPRGAGAVRRDPRSFTGDQFSIARAPYGHPRTAILGPLASALRRDGRRGFRPHHRPSIPPAGSELARPPYGGLSHSRLVVAGGGASCNNGYERGLG
jgi:hypothetical protein